MRFIFAGLLLILSTGIGAAPAVQQQVLSNGLKVIVKEDHRSPVVVSMIWYKVGSADEPAGITGVSHVLEHMLFKGTKRYKIGEFARIIAENGGKQNAFTSTDYTAYFEQLEKSRLPISFELEADRMRGALMDKKEFAKEIKVVIDERLYRTDNRASGKLSEKFMATAYRKHHYKNPIIGWMPDLKNMKASDARNWYRRWYTPRNATLVVVGDVKAGEVFALAQKYFGNIDSPKVNGTRIPVEPRQTKERRSRIKFPANVPSFILGYHVPTVGRGKPAWEPYALSVLSGILDGGLSARLETQLIRKQRVASSIGISYHMYNEWPTMFMFYGSPAKGRKIEDVEQALLQQIRRVQYGKITRAEIRRVKAQTIASQVFGRDSLFNQARLIGMMETTGRSWREVDQYVERIKAVTPAQVQQVARKYLVARNRTVTILDPTPIKDKKGLRRPAGGRHGR
jgi:zinc protease